VAGNVTGIILLFLGAFFVIRGLPGVVQLLRARTWQRVRGTMLGSGVAGYQTQATGGHMGANVQRAVFAYSYEVGGQTYTGHRAAFGTPLGFGMGLGGIASAQAGRYAPGEQVDVWVDPGDPSNAVLRRGAPSSMVLAALGVALLIAGGLSLAGG
jgi:uncharacterized membrane protein HdeD (DUF308 family)